MSKTTKFKVGQLVQFTKDWSDKIKPNFGKIHAKNPPDSRHVWVHFDVEAPPANILLVPVNKLEALDDGE
jgi:hypothetical protein